VAEQVGWVSTRSGEVFAGLSAPTGMARTTAVLLVPPFGWEGVSANRNLRAWARDLAEAGYPALRFHPVGSGDSTGASAVQDLSTWSTSLVDLAARTRETTGCARLAVIGLGLGGLVALDAVDQGADVDDLVLWATPSKGRLLLRELKAFAALTSEPGEIPSTAPQSLAEVMAADGSLWVHGYPLGLRAQDELRLLDVAELSLGRLERALVLGRGTLKADGKLVLALKDAGIDVAVGEGTGFDELTVEPRLSQPPLEVATTVLAWLPPDEGPNDVAPLKTVDVGETRLDLGDVDAILTTAASPVLTAVFVGSGAVPRSGPNRLWTEAARRWADLGVASLRLDLHGIGDAPGEDAYPFGPEGLHDAAYRGQIRDVLDEAVRRGLPDRFLLVGLCSGGFWAAQVGLDDDRVVGVIILNPGSLVWPPPLFSAGSRQYLTSKETWQRFVRDAGLRREAWARVRKSGQVMAGRFHAAAERPPATSLEVLEALRAKGRRVTVGLSPGEAATEDLHLVPDSPQVDVHWFDGPSGAHTLSPAVLRNQAAALMDERVREHLARIGHPSPAR
jgi:dienelactone hydrolase